MGLIELEAMFVPDSAERGRREEQEEWKRRGARQEG
jgi:hypothetical protein